jgi:hypothetical protein
MFVARAEAYQPKTEQEIVERYRVARANTRRRSSSVEDTGIDLMRKRKEDAEHQASIIICAARESAQRLVLDAVKQASAQVAIMMQDATVTAQKILNESIERLTNAGELQAYINELEATDRRRRTLSPYARIERRFCRLFKISAADVRSKRRTKEVVFVRQAIAYWCCRLTQMSLPEIGRRIGQRDHTTILHARRAYVQKRAAQGKNLRQLG